VKDILTSPDHLRLLACTSVPLPAYHKIRSGPHETHVRALKSTAAGPAEPGEPLNVSQANIACIQLMNLGLRGLMIRLLYVHDIRARAMEGAIGLRLREGAIYRGGCEEAPTWLISHRVVIVGVTVKHFSL